MAAPALHILRAGGAFEPAIEALIRDEIEAALETIHEHIPAIDLDLVVCHAPTATISGEFIGGRTYSPHLITLSLDTAAPDLSQVLRTQLKRILAHEYQHAARWGQVGLPMTLGDALVWEGTAESFSMALFPGPLQRWCSAFNSDALGLWIQHAQPWIRRSDYDFVGWFFGNSCDFPPWIGYTLGYMLVQDYMGRMRLPPKNLVGIPTEFVLDGWFQ